MSLGFTAIDLSKLPPPQVIESLDYESILAAMRSDFRARYPDYNADALESDPAAKLLEVAAYRETLIRGRVNDAAKAVMLAFARGSDLEHLAALYGVRRRIIDEGDPDALPAVPPTYEDDESLRRRIQLAPEALTTAGSAGAYIFHALSAGTEPAEVDVTSPAPGKVTVTYTYPGDSLASLIKDAAVTSPTPGKVIVTVLGRADDGTLAQEALRKIAGHLSGESVRPLTDHVTVQAATINAYTVTATLKLYDGPDAEVVTRAATDQFNAFAAARHRIGESITRSGIDAALHVAGVQAVTLDSWTDITADPKAAPYCTGLTLNTETTA
ncbi:MAG: baseplate J/gp47 family protein [Pseudomonadota bacterium]